MQQRTKKIRKSQSHQRRWNETYCGRSEKTDAKMVYISTDYVFDGQGETPWEPDCKAYAPLNVYGQTKLGGELAVAQTLGKYFIVRIAWVFGLNGKILLRPC